MRTTFDELEPATRPVTPVRRTRSAPTEPVGQIPSFVFPAGRGAGKTGFVSTKTKTKTKAKAKKRSGVTTTATPVPTAPTPPLLLSPSTIATTAERPTASTERPAAAEKTAAPAAA